MGATELPAPSPRSQSMTTLPRSQEGVVNIPEMCRFPEKSPPQVISHSFPPPSIKPGGPQIPTKTQRFKGIGTDFKRGCLFASNSF